MSHHFLVLYDGVPHTFHGGGGVTAYTVVAALLQAGHRVTVGALNHLSSTGDRSEQEHIEHLQSRGAEVRVLNIPTSGPPRSRLRRLLLPVPAEIIPGFLGTAAVCQLAADCQPDAVFAYHWNAAAAASQLPQPVFTAVGDPLHLPYLINRNLRRQWEPVSPLVRLRENLGNLFRVPAQQRLMQQLLNRSAACGAFAAHHAAMFRAQGVNSCRYLRTPVPDPLAARSAPRQTRNNKLRLLHIGHLRGTATLAGIEQLALQTLPELCRQLGDDGFELHLVGGYFEALPLPLQQALQHPAVKIRGQITPADTEFLQADALIVPTPVRLGIRVRIVTAFSFGTCVISHVANQAGIPELEHGINAMLGSDGIELAQHCVELTRQPERTLRLQLESRQTYQKHFSIGTAGAELVTQLCDICRSTLRKPSS